MLEHLRFPVASSRGRRYPEPEHPYRNPFQRDRDRIIHSRAFRRLEHKTQVFAPEISDHFRNRLTHTIEVSQIARTIASVLRLDEDLTESLALAHDTGHPPFAHAGEKALDDAMKRFGERFDHNAQSLRVLDSLERRYPRFPGLNLTFEVREGILKHSRDIALGEPPPFDAYLPGFRPPLEAQVIDLADEVAYNCADLDDAWNAGLLTPALVAEEVPVWASIIETVETQFPGASDHERFQEAVRHLVDHLVSGLIEGTEEAARSTGLQISDDVRAYPDRIVRFTRSTGETSRLMKQSLHRHVYSSPTLHADRETSITRLTRLFDYLLENPDKLPAQDEDADPVPPHRAVCDYLAGMTDRYFFRVYDKLLGSSECLLRLS
ncbi:MAG: putative deoxyguanosinetriphosphate triphosphohydrolase [Bryobacterales bacterium]|nr:putative deoxyguanosinetriphosphate triphosphohydrolase [Bryobacterales bacterium]